MGLVLSIERCSLHDGPGIRTTVFLKGCPLQCAWCHNPESQASVRELQFFSSRCSRCGVCVKACPLGIHALDTTDQSHTIDRSQCTQCGVCAEACPSDALKIAGTVMSAGKVMEAVEKDRCYYAESGGGITLSGGEPLYQFDFAFELLNESRKRGIHTCVETSGFVSSDRLTRILPLVDLFLFDYKATGEKMHQDLTGVGARTILSNLDSINRHGAGVILRCPLVPGINDTQEHLCAIAEIAAAHTCIQAVELMPYHNLASGKYGQIGLEYRLGSVKSAEESLIDQWIEAVRKAGYKNVTAG